MFPSAINAVAAAAAANAGKIAAKLSWLKLLRNCSVIGAACNSLNFLYPTESMYPGANIFLCEHLQKSCRHTWPVYIGAHDSCFYILEFSVALWCLQILFLPLILCHFQSSALLVRALQLHKTEDTVKNFYQFVIFVKSFLTSELLGHWRVHVTS